MNLDELQSIRDRERQSDSLQQLRESFYQDVGEFVQQLRDEREVAAEQADDPFDAPEVNRLTDDINTAEQTVEAIYERRVGKLVKMASFAAADMPTEDEGLTAEERALFEGMVEDIEQNRERVFAVLDGEDAPAPDLTSSATPADGTTDAPADTDTQPTQPNQDSSAPGATDTAPADPSPPEGVGAADLMGGDDSPPDSNKSPPDDEVRPGDDSSDRGDDPATTSDTPAPDTPATEGNDDRIPPTEEAASVVGDSPDSEADLATEQRTGDGDRDTAGTTPEPDGGQATVDRATVRITQDVGEIFGVDQREYELAREDVVTLPAANAEPLVERDAAERID